MFRLVIIYQAVFRFNITKPLRFIALPDYLLTNSMEHSPSWEANGFAASQEIPHILWNPKVYYHIYKSSPLVPILSQLDPHST
jgi:hypothetical protein